MRRYIPKTKRKYSYPPNWRELSKKTKIRDRSICQECGSKYNLNTHHIIEVSRGGSSKGSNLITLCERCHAKRHIRRMKRLL